jgi:hypothetical protein
VLGIDPVLKALFGILIRLYGPERLRQQVSQREGGSHMDVDQFALASLSEDHKEGVAAFFGRRKLRFKGR